MTSYSIASSNYTLALLNLERGVCRLLSHLLREDKMIEIIIASFVGSFMYDNADFFSTAKKQMEEGASWHISGPQDANPSVPSIPVKNPITGKDTVIWVLE